MKYFTLRNEHRSGIPQLHALLPLTLGMYSIAFRLLSTGTQSNLGTKVQGKMRMGTPLEKGYLLP